MSEIRGMLGFNFWIDNKRTSIEALLANKRDVPKEKQEIIRDLREEDAGEEKNHRIIAGNRAAKY